VVLIVEFFQVLLICVCVEIDTVIARQFNTGTY